MKDGVVGGGESEPVTVNPKENGGTTTGNNNLNNDNQDSEQQTLQNLTSVTSTSSSLGESFRESGKIFEIFYTPPGMA